MKLPTARNKNIVVQNLENEVLIYDLVNDKAYCLNETSAQVYRACDGTTTFGELKHAGNFSMDLIFLALDQLRENNLIENFESPFAGVSRREVIRRVGLASAAILPVVSGLVAPAAASAASTICTCSAPINSNARLEGCPCVSSNDCCGLCILATATCSEPQPLSVPTAAACCPMP